MTGWSLWGEPSKALLMVNFEGRNTNVLHWGSTWVEDRKSASTSSAGEREWMAVSFVVTVLPSTLSMCFHSQPWRYRMAEHALICLPSSQHSFKNMPTL